MNTIDAYHQQLHAELIRCQHWIEAALEYSGGTHEFEDIYNEVMRNNMQLWPREDACAVTQIITYPRKKVLHIFLAGGRMETIVDMDKDADDFAKRQGCSALSIAGRRGWGKILASNGYEPSFVTLGRDLV